MKLRTFSFAGIAIGLIAAAAVPLAVKRSGCMQSGGFVSDRIAGHYQAFEPDLVADEAFFDARISESLPLERLQDMRETTLEGGHEALTEVLDRRIERRRSQAEVEPVPGALDFWQGERERFLEHQTRASRCGR